MISFNDEREVQTFLNIKRQGSIPFTNLSLKWERNYPERWVVNKKYQKAKNICKPAYKIKLAHYN